MIFKQRVLVMHIVSALPIILAYLFNKYICILYFRGNTAPLVTCRLSDGFVRPPAVVHHLLSLFMQTFSLTNMYVFTPQVCPCKLGMRRVECGHPGHVSRTPPAQPGGA